MDSAQGIIDNGGLQYFFETDWEGQPPYAEFVDAFEAVGAPDRAAILDQAVRRLFPFDDPHLYTMKRQAVLAQQLDDPSSTLERLTDKLFSDARLRTTLEDFVRNNIDDFARPSAWQTLRLRIARTAGRLTSSLRSIPEGVFSVFTSDPSTEWPEHTAQFLSLVIPTRSLNGLTLGTPATDLAQLGRPSNSRPFKKQWFYYLRLGIEISIEDNAVDSFGFPLRKMDTDLVGPCELSVLMPDGVEIHAIDPISVEVFLAHLPPPNNVDTDEEETVYFFSLDGDTLELEVSPGGHVRRLNFFRPEPNV